MSYEEDLKKMYEHLEKLKKLDQSIKVYPGHGDETTLKREFENNPYLK